MRSLCNQGEISWHFSLFLIRLRLLIYELYRVLLLILFALDEYFFKSGHGHAVAIDIQVPHLRIKLSEKVFEVGRMLVADLKRNLLRDL